MTQRVLFGLLALTAAYAWSQSPNLLPNGDFSLRARDPRTALGWEPLGAQGTVIQVDRDIDFRGSPALCISATAAGEKKWHWSSRTVPGLRAGTPYTLSAYVRTEGLGDGSMAYISLNCYRGAGASNRLQTNDSPTKLSGTTDWTRIVMTIPELAKGSSEVRVHLCLYGTGTAWFTHVQVEEGSEATPFQPADADRRDVNQSDAQQAQAREWLAALPASAQRIAVLDLGPLDHLGPGRAPAAVPTLTKALATSGYQAVAIQAAQLINDHYFNSDNFELLVVPSGDVFPANAHTALTQFLQDGGLLLTMGGYAFDRPVNQGHDGRWRDQRDIPRDGLRPDQPVAIGDAGRWRPSTNRKDRPTQISHIAGPDGSDGIEIATPELSGWDTGLFRFADELPAEWSALSFWVKGGPETRRAWFELTEEDGSRWHYAVELTPEWREVVITMEQLTYWHDNPSIGRGGDGDFINPRAVQQLSFGVALDINQTGMAHRAAITGLKAGVDPRWQERLAVWPQINTRRATIRDAMWPKATQIGAFDPSFPLRDVARTALAPEAAGIFPQLTLPGAVGGWSAVAMLGLNGHGFGPNHARWLPLLECYDGAGSSRGHAAAVIRHFGGVFSGSSWAIFGVNDRDLFSADSPVLNTLLPPLLAQLLRRYFLHDTTTGYACYRHGETAEFKTTLSNYGDKDISTVVRFTLKDEAGAVLATWDQPTTVGPMASQTLTQAWPVPADAPDYIDFSAELWEDGRCLDREEGAVVIWTPAVIARGPKLAKDGLMLSIDGQARFFMGCQNYWGQHNSVTARSPRAFNRDFKQMREHHLRWSRCFLPIKSESDARVSDAIVQLAQKHGIVLYHTPNLSNTLEESTLAQQRQSAGDIGRRYRDVPGLALDICNEPSMKFAAPGFEQALGHAPKPDGHWADPQVHNTWRLVSDAQRRWAQNSRDAIKAEKPELPVSVGWGQGWSGGVASKDPLLASLDLDFTDRHYYGPPTAFAGHVKDVDLRVLGKPLIVGECGAKNHPTFKEQDPWRNGDDDESYSRRFLYLAHHAFGFGATALLSWHWRDPMEGIFPCGLIHQTGTPRPTAALYSDMARVFGLLELVDNPPDVVLLLPDYLRHTPKRGTLTEAAHNVTDALLWHGANLSLLPDSLASELPASVKLVIYPLPYVVSDETLQALTAFVQRGGVLWLSGDMSRDSANPRGDPIPARLEALCGVRPTARLTSEPMVAGPDTLPPVAAGPLAGQQFRPAMALELTTALAWFSAGDTPVVVQNRLGAGTVAFTADPLEISSLNRHAMRVIYGELLKQAGAQTTRRADTPEDLTIFRVPGRNGSAWVFWNNGQDSINAVHDDITLPVAAGYGACLIIGHNGNIIALEAHGDVRRGNKVVAKLNGHAFVVIEK